MLTGPCRGLWVSMSLVCQNWPHLQILREDVWVKNKWHKEAIFWGKWKSYRWFYGREYVQPHIWSSAVYGASGCMHMKGLNTTVTGKKFKHECIFMPKTEKISHENSTKGRRGIWTTAFFLFNPFSTNALEQEMYWPLPLNYGDGRYMSSNWHMVVTFKIHDPSKILEMWSASYPGPHGVKWVN